MARYFERVLGVKNVMALEVNLPHEVASPPAGAVRALRSMCLLIEVGSGSETPSLQQMGTRLLEAIRMEWVKTSPDSVPEMEWIQVADADWEAALEDNLAKTRLAIVSGASHVSRVSSDVIHVGSFAEMNGSPNVKRDAWRAIQKGIALST